MVPKLEPQEKNLLRKALSFAQKKNVKLYLVGGYLRDIILKRKKENPDIDFCLKKGAINFGRGLARELEAGFVVLDKEHGCARLVKRIGKRAYTLDFTDFRGRTLEDDLRARDFTINALAIELKDFLRPGDLNRYLVDPAGARKALEKKVICAIGKNGFDADPLRILRAFSLSAIFGFKICPRTCRW